MNGTAWKTARNELKMSLDEACYGVRDKLGPGHLSRSTLHRMETENIDLHPLVITTLASVYGKNVSEIDPDEATKLSELRDLLIQQSPCIAGIAA